jgi:hypothetical protein
MDGDLHANLDKNRRNRDTRGYIDQRHMSVKSESCNVTWITTASTELLALFIASWSARSATATFSRIGNMPSTRRTTVT